MSDTKPADDEAKKPTTDDNKVSDDTQDDPDAEVTGGLLPGDIPIDEPGPLF